MDEPKKRAYEDEPPIGMLPDGSLNVVQKGSPREEPDVEDEDEPDGLEKEPAPSDAPPAQSNGVQININRRK